MKQPEEITIEPLMGGDTRDGWAYVAIEDSKAAVALFLGDGKAPFTITDAMDDVDLADLDPSSLQRAVIVARLRSIADQIEAEGIRLAVTR